jgi:hypothetical protein
MLENDLWLKGIPLNNRENLLLKISLGLLAQSSATHTPYELEICVALTSSAPEENCR